MSNGHFIRSSLEGTEVAETHNQFISLTVSRGGDVQVTLERLVVSEFSSFGHSSHGQEGTMVGI